MKIASVILLLLASALAQENRNPQAETSGVCSPVFQNNTGKVDFVCDAMDKATAAKIVSLLNVILKNTSGTLDTNKKLDDILLFLKSHVHDARRLPADRSAFIECLKAHPGKFSVAAIQDNQEAYTYAQDWHDVFIAAGWQAEDKDTPIEIFTIGGGMWSGLHINVHAALKDTTQTAENSPEQHFIECVGRVPLGAVGAIVPYYDIPSASVRIEVSTQP